jgi:hypothetical protein
MRNAPPVLAATPPAFDADRIYRLLIEAHRGLDERQSAALDARLVLALAHAVGDAEKVAAVVDLVRQAEPSANQ